MDYTTRKLSRTGYRLHSRTGLSITRPGLYESGVYIVVLRSWGHQRDAGQVYDSVCHTHSPEEALEVATDYAERIIRRRAGRSQKP